MPVRRAAAISRCLGSFVIVTAVACRATDLAAQPRGDSSSAHPGVSNAATVVTSAVLVAGVALFDAQVQRFAASHQTRALDRVADAVDPLGRAGYIVPALAGSYLLARLSRRERFAAAVVRVAAGYFAADAIGSVLKPAIGRRRPGAGGAWTFRPLRQAPGEWRAFPSAHAFHATALAASIATEARRPWVTAIGASAAILVGAQRVYTGAHWPSDVVAGGVIGVVAGGATVRWLRRREGK